MSSYHQEALRKQRVVDRAYQARIRLEQEMQEEFDSLSRPQALVRTAEFDEVVEMRSSRQASCNTSRPASQQSQGLRHSSSSQEGSRPSSQRASQQGSRQNSRPSSRPSSQQGGGRTSGRTSATQSPGATINLSPDEIARRDLRKKELSLRDNNLTMGHISPREHLQDMM